MNLFKKNKNPQDTATESNKILIYDNNKTKQLKIYNKHKKQ